MNILLVDDDTIIRKGMRKMIEKSGKDYTVVGEAGNGEIALQLLEEQTDSKVDLVITDMQMPLMDGLTLIGEIKKRNISVKLITLSGYNDFHYVRNSFIGGGTDYLLKPVNREELLNCLEKIQEEIRTEQLNGIQNKKNKEQFIVNKLREMCHNKAAAESPQQLADRGIDFVVPYEIGVLWRNLSSKEEIVPEELDLLIDRIQKELVEYVEQACRIHLYCFYEPMKVIFVLFGSQDAQFAGAEDAISRYLNGELSELSLATVGLSRVHTGSDCVSQAYSEAQKALDMGFEKEGTMFRYEGEKTYREMNQEMEAVAKKLSHYVELGDYVNGKRVIENLFANLQQCHPDAVRKGIEELLAHLFYSVREFGIVMHMEEGKHTYFIQNIQSFQELKSYMLHMLHDVIDYIQIERKKGSQARIDIAKKYMQTHYMESITLNDLADYVELNPSYFSNLFKVETGVNFSDYLLDIRIGMAKKLLRDPKNKIYEVGNKVGYEDVVSFGRAFKKKIGMSPKEYRNAVYLSNDAE